MIFRLTADARFTAKNIDDALKQLGEYLIKRSRGYKGDTIFLQGCEFDLRPATAEMDKKCPHCNAPAIKGEDGRWYCDYSHDLIEK